MSSPGFQPDSALKLVDLHPDPDDLRQDVLVGLSASPKAIPCKYFYDARGSALFDQICELPEYYPTRTELSILTEHVRDMTRRLGPRCEVVEFGSGSGQKTEILLEALEDPVAYVPVEISRGHLMESATALARQHPTLEVLPVCADFTQPFPLPRPRRTPRRSAVFFPGSTVGNFAAPEAEALLRNAADLVGESGALLIGTDLVKDVTVLEAAYNDAAGVTAAFNLNLLHRINREVGADFDLQAFRHVALYHPEPGRIDMYLESLRDQCVRVGDREFPLARGERIHTESSHKYTLDGFPRLAARAGWTQEAIWTDPRAWFAVWLLVRNPDAVSGS